MMILDSKIALSLLAILPVALGELEPHRARSRRHHGHTPRPREVDIDISISLGGNPESSSKPRFPYGEKMVRGVNLGGWLVLEPWITPSLFDGTGKTTIIDEYTFGQFQDKAVAKAKLVKHWNTWITEPDFAAIAAAGLNHVRIPIGYWAFDTSAGEPYVSGQYPYLQEAVKWAKVHGLKVLIDLHGAPGSQNGFDNSGRAGNTTWHLDQKNVDRTNAIIKKLAKEFSQDKYKDTVTAIAPLNEPASFRDDKVLPVTRQYWKDSYQNIRYPTGDVKKPGPLIEVIHDAFQPLSSWDGFMTKPEATGVAMDTHHYEVFSDGEVARSFDEHIQSVCDFGINTVGSYASKNLPTVVGEWSNAMTDCAKYLNGRPNGARYDGTFTGSTKVGDCGPKTGSGLDFTDEYKTELRKFWEAQATAYEYGKLGWIFWTWKAEIAAEWSYQAGLAGGWIPKNPEERKYP
ncbi:exo-1,3-beta-glucanase, partial [Ceratobasidium sp. 395]